MLPGYMFRRMWVTRWGKVTLKKLLQESEYPGFSTVTGTISSQFSEWSCQSPRIDLTKHWDNECNSRQWVTCATASNWLSEAAIPVRSPSRANDGTDCLSESHTRGITQACSVGSHTQHTTEIVNLIILLARILESFAPFYVYFSIYLKLTAS